MRNLSLIFVLLFTSILNAQIWEERNTTPFELDHGFAFSLKGKGYFVTGGGVNGDNTYVTKEFYSYEVTTDTWTKLEDFPGTARGYAVGAVMNGKAYLGFGVGSDYSDLKDLWVFDPDTETWSELASCTCSGRGHPAFLALNNKIYVGLGNNFVGNLNDWWIYDAETDSWSEGEDFPSYERHHPFYFSIGDYVYAGMGHGTFMSDGVNIYKDLYRYDPQTDEWEEMEGIPGEGRVAGTQFNYNGKGYALSGQGNDHWFMESGEFWEYDPQANNWTSLAPHPGISRWAPGSFIIDNYVYIISGTTATSVFGSEIYSNEVWRYDLGENTVSVDEINLSEVVYIQINRDYIVLDTDGFNDYKLTIYNVMGQQIFNQNVQNKQTNIAHLQTGVYLLSLSNDRKEVKNIKFVKN